MTQKTKRYTNDEITVIWQAECCTHSQRCWRELPAVFNPQQRPWINLDGAKADLIVKQVKACPSGALSLERGQSPDARDTATKIKVTKAGPLLLEGNFLIEQTDGEVIHKQGMTALCRCGGSKNKPFCDGSHHQLNFED